MDKKILVAASAIVLVAVAAIVLVVVGVSDTSEVKKVGVIYDGNGGDNDGETEFLATSHTVYPNMFELEDRAFLSWNTKADGSGTTYKEGDSISYPSDGTVTLFAQWGYSFSAPTFSTSGPTSALISVMFSTPLGTSVLYPGFSCAFPTGEWCAVTVSGTGYEWTYDEGSASFVGVTDGYRCTVKLTFEGADPINRCDDPSVGLAGFRADGSVDCTVKIVYSSLNVQGS